MTVIDLLDRGLFVLGELLRAPVVLLLWACILWAAVLLGAWLSDALAQSRARRSFDVAAWSQEPAGAKLPGPLGVFYQEALALPRDETFLARMEECLHRYEARLRDTAEGARVLVKVGPSLGLLGTLIPMGSSLAKLSQGNLEGMSAQMVAAFTSTIVGLAAGTLAFAVASQRQRWVTRDLRELRLVADLLVARK